MSASRSPVGSRRVVVILSVLAALLIAGGLGWARLSEARLQRIRLSFVPMPQTTLAELDLSASWRLVDSRIAHNVAGISQVLVAIYQTGEDQRAVVLQDRFGFYDLGMDFEGDPERVWVTARDTNGDGASELMVTVDRGTTYREVRAYTYDGERWICLLATENLLSIDLDGDGHDELVTTSMGSLPGYIWIYRWHEGRFEKSDVVADAKVTYAALVSRDGHELIELGDPGQPRTYEYRASAGVLVRVGR